jgi:hypothetical protein
VGTTLELPQKVFFLLKIPFLSPFSPFYPNAICGQLRSILTRFEEDKSAQSDIANTDMETNADTTRKAAKQPYFIQFQINRLSAPWRLLSRLLCLSLFNLPLPVPCRLFVCLCQL